VKLLNALGSIVPDRQIQSKFLLQHAYIFVLVFHFTSNSRIVKHRKYRNFTTLLVSGRTARNHVIRLINFPKSFVVKVFRKNSQEKSKIEIWKQESTRARGVLTKIVKINVKTTLGKIDQSNF